MTPNAAITVSSFAHLWKKSRAGIIASAAAERKRFFTGFRVPADGNPEAEIMGQLKCVPRRVKPPFKVRQNSVKNGGDP